MDQVLISRRADGDQINYEFLDLVGLKTKPGAAIKVPKIQMPDGVDSLLADGFVEAGETRNAENLLNCGDNLWRYLEHDSRLLLHGLTTPLLLGLDHAAMPWELAHDGNDYLCLQRVVSRCSTLYGASTADLAPPGSSTDLLNRKWLVIGDPKGDLPGARIEAAALQELADDLGDMHHKLTFISSTGRQAGIFKLRGLLAAGCMMFHYSGHADFTSGALLLNDMPLTTVDIEKVVGESRQKPIVFLNACSTDRTNRTRNYADTGGSIAEAFLSGGAKLVVSTLWKIPDDSARDFSLCFYRNVFEGLTFGQALLAARRERRDAAPGDPTWAAFVMYGNPEHRIVLGPGWRDYTRLQLLDAAKSVSQALGSPIFDIPHLLIALLQEQVGAGAPASLNHSLTRAALRRLNVDCSGFVTALVANEAANGSDPNSAPTVMGPGLNALLAAAVEDRNRRMGGATPDTPLYEADLLLGLQEDSQAHNLLLEYANISSGQLRAVVLDLLREAGRSVDRDGKGDSGSPSPSTTSLPPKDSLVSGASAAVQGAPFPGASAAQQTPIGNSPGSAPGVQSQSVSRSHADPMRTAGVPAASRQNAINVRTPLLDSIGRDLVQDARNGKLRRVIGREKETGEVMETLVRLNKSNPVLIGEAGVGKTAIVEGLAQQVADGNVPGPLLNLRIVEVPVSQLVSNTMFRGQLEERIRQLIKEIEESDTVVFLDEVHTLVGAGQANGGTLDVANILKPALAAGRVRCIGATTTAEYMACIAPDAALERRFQPIVVKEVDSVQTANILEEVLIPELEARYGVRIEPGLSSLAVRLAVQYIAHRSLPDKAIDLLQSACGHVMLAGARDAHAACVTQEVLLSILSKQTGIPIDRLVAKESDVLRGLYDDLERQIIGHSAALQEVARVIRQKSYGSAGQQKSPAVLLFVGPEGVGMSETARALARSLHGSGTWLRELDASELSTAHMMAQYNNSRSSFFGSSHSDGSVGASSSHAKPVILVRHIEKILPDNRNVLVEFRNGSALADGSGRLLDIQQAIFVLTCDITAIMPELQGTIGLRSHTQKSAKSVDVKAKLAHVISAEFLSGVDSIVVFESLSAENAAVICERLMDDLRSNVQETNGIRIRTADGAISRLICRAVSRERYTVRELRRAFERLVASPVADAILDNVDTARIGEMLLTISEEHVAPVRVS